MPVRPFPRLLFAFVLVLCSAVCLAKPPFLKVFMATYNISPDSAIGKLRCLNCHLPPGPPNRNPYGLAVQHALEDAQQRMVTAEILQGIEKKDDGDGVPFITKIKKDIPPAQPVPAPKKPAIKKPVPKTQKKPVAHKKRVKRKRHAKKRALYIPAGSRLLILLCAAPLAIAFNRKRV